VSLNHVYPESIYRQPEEVRRQRLALLEQETRAYEVFGYQVSHGQLVIGVKPVPRDPRFLREHKPGVHYEYYLGLLYVSYIKSPLSWTSMGLVVASREECNQFVAEQRLPDQVSNGKTLFHRPECGVQILCGRITVLTDEPRFAFRSE
jgi:hypothetical protein